MFDRRRNIVAGICFVALLAGCGSSPRRGGYYQDDGPGGTPPANLDRIEDAKPQVETLNRGANNPYTVFGQKYVPHVSPQSYRQQGVASWYGRKFHGQKTSSGERYDMYAMTAAHTILPIPSYARVTNLANGRSVIVRVNDRGPFHSGRIIDLSYAAAYKLGYVNAGSARVEVEAILPEEMHNLTARKVEPRPEPVRSSESAAIPVETGAAGTYVQLGAFSERDNAEAMRAKIYQQLGWLNQSIEIYQKDNLFRLHLGPYKSREEAAGVVQKISETLEMKPVIVVR